jgi:hypothetical protein
MISDILALMILNTWKCKANKSIQRLIVHRNIKKVEPSNILPNGIKILSKMLVELKTIMD